MQFEIPIWKEAPFLRLFIPFAGGIVIQWYLQLPGFVPGLTITGSAAIIIAFGYLQTRTRFRFYGSIGIIINLMLSGLGAALGFFKTSPIDPGIFTGSAPGNTYIATIREPVTEKQNSFKTEAILEHVFTRDSLLDIGEKFIIYFPKDSACAGLTFNSKIVFKKPLKRIKNNGNPGGFDYREFCKMQGIRFEVYLRVEDYVTVPRKDDITFKGLLVGCREKITRILRENIPGEKEAGLAEALLIGYKDDLDKGLVQSYTNTGVVHVIAISGMHVGLIYWLSSMIFSPLSKIRRSRWLKAALIICSLWAFGFVAGGSPSVMRSALMFSFVVMGENIGKRTAVFNSLGASAFLLLCYNPLWLFDAGFQLSYGAVLSILIFMKPVYHALIIKNKLLDITWKMCALSIAAQILTTPLSIFLFGQFPNYFLVSNLVAVPLSSLVIFCELCLCAVAAFPQASTFVGGITAWLISVMNAFIEHINLLPFSTLQGLQLSFAQVILVYAGIASCAYWIFRKQMHALIITLVCIVSVLALRSFKLVESSNQCKLIIYNIARHRAIDLVEGNRYVYVGDQGPQINAQYNFVTRPARQQYGITDSGGVSSVVFIPNGFCFRDKGILLIDAIPLATTPPGCVWDVVVLSGNPDLSIAYLLKTAPFKCLVFDGSIPVWRLNEWIAECGRLHVYYHAVTEKGAFILNMN